MVSVAQQKTTGTKRAAIYCRVSTRAQDDEGTSLETQEAASRRYAAENGYDVSEADIHREVYTGAELWDRPGLTALRDSVRRHQVDIVIAYAIDRLSRDPVHLGVILTEADHHGVPVLFVSEPLDDSPEGQLIRFVRGYAAKVEHEKIRERTIRGKLARAQAGALMPGRYCPIGYQWALDDRGKKSRYAIDPETAPIVVKLFGDALAGTSLRQMAKALDAAGVPTASGAPHWQISTLNDMLRNSAYMGEVVSQKVKTTGRRTTQRDPSEWIRIPVPAIVTPAVWEGVQAALSGAGRVHRRNLEPERYLLRAGFAYCGLCGRMLVAYRHPNQRESVSYRYACFAKRKGVDCREHSISVRKLDGPVWSLCRELVARPEVIEERLRQQSADTTLNEDAETIASAIQEVERRQTNIARRLPLIDDDDAAAPLIDELTALSNRRRSLIDARAEVAGRAERLAAAAADAEQRRVWLGAIAKRLDNAPYEIRRDVLKALGVRVKLYPPGHGTRWEMAWSPVWDAEKVPVTSARSSSTVRQWDQPGTELGIRLRWTDLDCATK